jgi:hypothetical protein
MKTTRRIHRIRVDKSSEIVFFYNGGKIAIYRMTPKRRKTLENLAGYYRFIGPNDESEGVLPKRAITPHKGGRRAEFPRSRLTEDTRRKLDDILERRKMSAADWVTAKIEEETMDKNTDTVYYCSAQGHFWKWQYSPENGGQFFPALVGDEDAPDEYEELNCGCND